jgi:transposase-like protein
MILNALVERLKRRSKHDFKDRHFEATLILQAVSWDLRYPLSSRDIEELFLERGLEVDHSTLSHWVERFALRQCVQTRLHMIAVAKVIANSDPHQMH